MTNSEKIPQDTETILLALDQISQTIDVITSVVGRLRTYVRDHDTVPPGADAPQGVYEEVRTGKIVH